MAILTIQAVQVHVIDDKMSYNHNDYQNDILMI